MFNLHIFYEVYITTSRNSHRTFLYMQGRISKYIKVSSKSKVLLIIGNKVDMITQISININSILYIISIERNGCFTYWTCKRILKKTHIIVINIHIGKNILQKCIDNLTCLNHFIDTFGLLSHYNFTLSLWIFSVNMLSYRFIYRQRKNEFVVIWTCFYLI